MPLDFSKYLVLLGDLRPVSGSGSNGRQLRRTISGSAERSTAVLVFFTLLCIHSPQLLAQSNGGGLRSQIPTLDQLINRGTNADTREQGLSASLRIGLSYVDNAGNSGDYRLEDFDSHIGWGGRAALSAGLNADGKIELGVRPERLDSFELGVRELWAGLSGPWGLIRAGRQHATFYEMISSATDVAVWGSCWTQFECSRKSQVIKYRSPPAPLVFGFSVVARTDDGDEEEADQFEYGLGYQAGSFYFGIAGSQTGDEGDLSGGNLLGAVLTFGFSGGSLTFGYQQTDAEQLVAPGEEVTHLTLSLVYGVTYLIYNQTEIEGREPVWFTLGARQGLGSGASLFYEYQQFDLDEGEDEDLYLRAGIQFDW